jgi:hypothetical protein
MQRDTPQGFVTSVSVQNSNDAIRLMSKFSKASYESEDIPDKDSPSKSFVRRKDDRRQETFQGYIAMYKQRHPSPSVVGMLDFFERVKTLSLSVGYNKLLGQMKTKLLPMIVDDGFLGGIL